MSERLNPSGAVDRRRSIPVLVILALAVASCGPSGVPLTSEQPAATPISVAATPSLAQSPLVASPSPGTVIASKLTYSLDAAAATEATINFDSGGTVAATAADGSTFQLVLPPHAVLEDTLIRMTPLADVEGFGSGPVHAVRLEPEGLVFYDVPRLTITPSTPIPIADQLIFQATGEGEYVQAALVDPQSEQIVILVQHFSIDGVGFGSQAAWLQMAAAGALVRIGHAAGTYLQAERKRQLAGAPQDPVYYETLAALFDQADIQVLAPLRAAALLTCEGTEKYVAAMRSLEYQRQRAGVYDDVGSTATQTEIARATDDSFSLCERDAIEDCTERSDPSILVAFWGHWDRQRALQGLEPFALTEDSEERARQLCGKAYQFEFSGTAVGRDAFGPVEVDWHYWGLKCPDSDEWRLWEEFKADSGQSTNTGPPGGDHSQPELLLFDENGVLLGMTWPGFGLALPGTTAQGTRFTLTPPLAPTRIDAFMNAGQTPIQVSADVIPADGTIGSCESAVR